MTKTTFFAPYSLIMVWGGTNQVEYSLGQELLRHYNQRSASS